MRQPPDWENQGHKKHGGFAPKGDIPLSKKSVGCRVPVDIEKIIEEYFKGKPKSSRSDWLRKVIQEAVEKDLIDAIQEAEIEES